jgi:DNA (cytosine-5)-methyltransferase 1
MRPRLLDLFCGAGGAAVGYHRAGFDVVGVDVKPQPNYPFTFHQADAMTFPLDGFDAIHASPPCQGETALRSMWQDRDYERLLIPTLERFASLVVPWVVENVDNADAPVDAYKVRLCGSSFGLMVRRHRWFWSNVMMLVPSCDHATQGTPIGVYGHGGGGQMTRGVKATRENGWHAMGIDHRSMSWRGLTNAIPPAYTEHIGAQLLAACVPDEVNEAES